MIAERTFPIQEYDTPESIAVKTSLLGVECLVDAIRSEEAQGSIDGDARRSSMTAREDGQGISGYRATDVIRRNRNRFRPPYGRPMNKLLARFLLYPIAWLSNLRRWANRDFPIVILFGHLITDRPHFMGVSTDQFLKQVKFLKKHYSIASLPDAIKMLEEGKAPAPTVVLTFDDGYEDNHLGLRAVIDWEEIPVALFVCTQTGGRTSTLRPRPEARGIGLLPFDLVSTEGFRAPGQHDRQPYSDALRLRIERRGLAQRRDRRFSGGSPESSGLQGTLFLVSFARLSPRICRTLLS